MYELFIKLYYSLSTEQINLLFKLIDTVKHHEDLKDVTEKDFESLFDAVYLAMKEHIALTYSEMFSSMKTLIVYLMKHSVGETITLSEDDFQTSGCYSHNVKIEALSSKDVKISLIGLN